MPSALIWQTKIADFGVSTSIGTLSFANTVVGTPSYMAPEVLCGEAEAGGAAADMSSYREPADVWSLGVVLFEALVLSRPFEVRAVRMRRAREPRATTCDARTHDEAPVPTVTPLASASA